MGEKRPTDHMEPAAKKRGNDRQITKDDASEDDEQPIEAGDISRASEDVLKQRKIVKARRGGGDGTQAAAANPFAAVQLTTASIPAAPASNPFAGIALAPPQPAATPAATAVNEGETKEEGTKQPALGGGSGAGGLGFGHASGGFGFVASGNQQPSLFGGGSTTAATGNVAAPIIPIFGFGAPTTTITTAAAPSIFTTTTSTFPSTLTTATETNPSAEAEKPPASIFGSVTATGTVLSSTAPAATAAAPTLPEVAVSTGEESEDTIFSESAALYEFVKAENGGGGGGWTERGKGVIKVNVDRETKQARFVMRNRGNLKLLLNANLFESMSLSRMEGGLWVSIGLVNGARSEEAEGSGGAGAGAEEKTEAVTAKGGITAYGVRFRQAAVLDQFIQVCKQHGGHEKLVTN